MSAGFSQNQRSSGGHRPPLQQTKTALRQFCNTLLRGLRGGGRDSAGVVSSAEIYRRSYIEASPYRARASRHPSYRATLPLRGGEWTLASANLSLSSNNSGEQSTRIRSTADSRNLYQSASSV